jgi:hypothetical protein
MAEFSANLNPANTNQMSLGDMLKMSYYSSQSDIAATEAKTAKEKIKELLPVQAFMANPDNYSTDGKLDPDKAAPALMAIAPLTGPGHIEKLQTLAQNQTAITESRMKLTNQERTVFAQVDGALGQAKVDDPSAYIQAYKAIAQQYPYNPNIAKLADAKISNVNLAGNGQHLWQQALRSSNQMMSLPEQQAAFAPKAGTAQIGQQIVGTVTQPSIEGRQPTVSTSPLGGGQGSVTPGGTEGSTKPMPKLIQEDTSMNYTGPANPLNLNKFQEESYAKGKTNVTEANMAVKSVKDLQQSVRKVEEYIGSATGAGLVQKLQAGGKWAWGNPELDALVKNVAQVQARNASIMGLDKTDASRDLNAKLSGSEKIDPQALGGVMQQVKGEATAAELYTAGLNKFVEKRGDVNGYIQQQKFQNKWAEHYDPRIFQVDNIAQSNLPEPQKEAKIKDITSRMSKDDFAKYKEDRLVIHRLAKGMYQ